MKPTKGAYDLIKHWEGCRLESYQDSIGKWTIGYGQTGAHIGPGLKITETEAEQWLKNRVEELARSLTALIKPKLELRQFEALISLTYNIGIAAFAKSTLLKKLNNDQIYQAGDEILKWDHAGGQVFPGLTKRRLAEYNHFQFS